MKKIMKKVWKRCPLLTMLLFFCLGSSICYASQSKGINVNYHTQEEIREYLKENKVDIYAETKYSVSASNKKPYKAGELSSSSLKSALATMNAVRYIAGIDANVKLDDSYNEMAQAAALVNSANGTLSHSPAQPSGMSDSLYNLGYQGASESNLAMASWKTGLGYSIVHQWMNDGDSSNIDRVGHRRWVLNPSMQKTGFGWVYDTNGTYTAMYAFDSWYNATEYYGVAWPAQNMPVEYFGSSYPWSISMGTPVDGSKVKVTLTRTGDNKKWTFSASKADGYFNVENSNYGKQGCIIFRPDNMTYQAGDQFEVKIAGLDEKVSYQVNFFSADAAETTCSHTYGSATVTKKATLTTNGKKTSVCTKCGKTKKKTIYKASAISLAKKTVTYNGKTQNPKVVVKDSKGKIIADKYYTVTTGGTPKESGMYQVTVKLKGKYSGTKKLDYTIKPKTADIKKLKSSKHKITVTIKQAADITGYEISYSVAKNFKKASTVKVEGKASVQNELRGLKGKTTYYVRVRTYKTATYNGKEKIVYSSWSEVKNINTK